MKRREDGRWQKGVTLPNGKLKIIYSTASSERMAIKDFNEQLMNLKIELKNKSLFENIAKEWADENFPKMHYNTLKVYRTGYAAAIDFFSGQAIQDIKTKDVRKYLNGLTNKGYALKTVKNRMLVLGLIFKHAVLNEYIEYDVCSPVKIPKNLPKAKRQSASKEDERAICENTNSLCGVLAFLYLTTGCRRGEALALTPQDVDVPHKLISVTKTMEWEGNVPHIKNSPKTASGIRQIPINDKLIFLLTPYMKQKHLFQNEKGEMITNIQFTRMWKKYQTETGITCTPHQLRHSYATLLFDADIDVKTAQTWLGHADINTTLGIYTHLSDLKQSESVKKLNDFLTKF